VFGWFRVHGSRLEEWSGGGTRLFTPIPRSGLRDRWSIAATRGCGPPTACSCSSCLTHSWFRTVLVGTSRWLVRLRARRRRAPTLFVLCPRSSSFRRVSFVFFVLPTQLLELPSRFVDTAGHRRRIGPTLHLAARKRGPPNGEKTEAWPHTCRRTPARARDFQTPTREPECRS